MVDPVEQRLIDLIDIAHGLCHLDARQDLASGPRAD
jgi:hypothetical protein